MSLIHKFKDFKKRVKYQNQKMRPDDKTGSFGITQINASTLWHYQNGRITVYKFSNKCFL
jgi:hypothetical protein